MGDFWSDAAAWVQAVGTVAAVIWAAWIARGEARAALRREELGRIETLEREARSLAAARTAALNLAILAATHIRQLHALLRDEPGRGNAAGEVHAAGRASAVPATRHGRWKCPLLSCHGRRRPATHVLPCFKRPRRGWPAVPVLDTSVTPGLDLCRHILPSRTVLPTR